jgi:O-antigen/teichoic acid export membrane protein
MPNKFNLMNSHEEHSKQNKPKRGLARLFRATIIKETAWLAGGFASKLLIQMGTLYYLTHNLGVERVGIFFALISLLACLVPFVQLGNYDLTIRQIARREDPQLVAGRAMRSSAAGFFILLPILLLLRPLLAGQVSWAAYLMVAFSELLVMRVLSNIQAVATGFRLHYVCAVSDFLIGLSRFIAVYIAARLGAGVNVVLMLYAFTTAPATLAAYVWMVRRIGTPTYGHGPIFTDIKDHLNMIVAWFGEMAAREGDKPLLNAFSNSRQTGIYGTATRLFSVMLVPIDVLTQVFRPRVSEAYADGDEKGLRLWRIMAAGLGGCGVLTGAGLFVAAYLIPYVAPSLIKSEFAEARIALMYLAFVPPLYGLQRANVVSAIARGAVGSYAAAIAAGAVCAVGTLIALAPAHGWRGACVATQVYLAVSCVTTWVFSRNVLSIHGPVKEPVIDIESTDSAPLVGELEAVTA